MVALCFANGLQGGGIQTFAQSTEALKHTFHVKDVALGVVPFAMAVTGNIGAVPIAALCARYRRTAVLAGMFGLWGVVMAFTAMVPSLRLLGVASIGFVMFALLRVGGSLLEATDPAALPLIADYWPVERRAGKVGIFNAGAAVGAFIGLVGAGVVVDHWGWRWAFAAWLPLGLLGAVLMRSRREPVRGEQDAAYGERLAAEVDDIDLLVELVGPVAEPPDVIPVEPLGEDRWATVRTIARLRTWRVAAVGLVVAMIMTNGLMNWGIAYFKRTFGLSGTQAAAMAPLLGIGAFAGLLGGGFLADRLLRRGVVRARVYVTVAGYVGAGLCLMATFDSTRLPVAAPLLAVGAGLAAVPTGPQFALLMDVTPSSLRSQASAAFNVLQATTPRGAVVVGGLSTLFGENLRLALLCVSPLYIVGGLVVLAARRTYVEDVAAVVADARVRAG
jgi:MFS family permease